MNYKHVITAVLVEMNAVFVEQFAHTIAILHRAPAVCEAVVEVQAIIDRLVKYEICIELLNVVHLGARHVQHVVKHSLVEQVDNTLRLCIAQG